jgi:aryl-alcohol dehydrogenase-like predicted oxidoreductase
MFRDIEKPMEPFCVKYGMGMNSYFPLAGGLLTGKYPPPAYFGMERSLPGFESLPLRQQHKISNKINRSLNAIGFSPPDWYTRAYT